MKKLMFAGVCAVALTASGAMAQVAQGQGGQPSHKSGGMMKDPSHGADMKAGSGAAQGGSVTTGRSPQDAATVPGSLNAGGTSPSSPNTTQPGASKQGGTQ